MFQPLTQPVERLGSFVQLLLTSVLSAAALYH